MQVVDHPFFNVPTWPIFTKFLSVTFHRPFDTDLLRWEWITLLLCVLILTNTFLVADHRFVTARLRFTTFAQNQRRAIWTCALLPVVVRILLLPIAPVKPPSVHDEFSLFLLGDTLRSGRLTNKTHLFWQHFETVHVIQQPTYSSMYPPGSGLFPALGILLGNPWIGILLSIGIMCAALCWALQAWRSPTWAFCIALLAALQIGIGSFWMNSLMGVATVPAIGGAFILGVIPRFLRQPTKKSGVIFALGVSLLVSTRPLEGTVLSMLFVLVALHWNRRAVFGIVPIHWRVLVPGACVLLLCGLFTAYDSWRISGNPLKMAYVVNRDTYGWPENLAILPPKTVSFRHPNLATVYQVEVHHRDHYLTLGRMFDSWISRAVNNWEFYVGPGLTLSLIFLWPALRNHKLRWLFYVLMFMLGLNALQLMAYPQHLAPEMAIIYLLLGASLQRVYHWAQSRQLLAERLLVACFTCVAIGASFNLFMEPLGLVPVNFWEWPHWGYFRQRAAVISKLESFPGKHLILVRYTPTHSPHEEWVYNAANIDRSRIVWANAMDAASDSKLRQYFHDRQAWIIEPDRDPTSFLPLTESTYKQ